MQILLVAVNAKYVHTNLAIRYLRECVSSQFPVQLKEFTINERIERIAEDIFEAKADVIGFSCYIWNIKTVLDVAKILKRVAPHVRIVLGGPEVSFDSEELMEKYGDVDAVVVGEGERSFLELLQAWNKGDEPSQVKGIVWRQGEKIIKNPPSAERIDINRLPSPYGREEDFSGRLVYVETTRGCPFQCQYCLSSTFTGVTYLEPERFRMIFRTLLKYGARTIKFVDRTFNVRKDHAMAILDIVREEGKYCESELRVHVEIAGDLLDDEWLDYLSHYPPGLLQMEIGVQSTYKETLKIIKRPQRFEQWKKYIKEIKKQGHIHLHLDLIAGLPEENWQNFAQSFNDVYSVEPDMLQLGFLKLLKGSGLRRDSLKYGLIYNPEPPYTVLKTSVMSHEEIIQLRRIEEVLDRYYNSGKFSTILPKAIGQFKSPFDFYHELALYWQEQGWFNQSFHGKALFERLWLFLCAAAEKRKERERLLMIWREALKFDYYLWERPAQVPEFLEPRDVNSEEFKKQAEKVRYSPQWLGIIPSFQTFDRRQWARATAVGSFAYDVGRTDGEKEPKEVWYLFTYEGKSRAFRYHE